MCEGSGDARGGGKGRIRSGGECVAVMLAFELRWLDVVQDVVPGSRYATISRLGGGATCGETCVILS